MLIVIGSVYYHILYNIGLRISIFFTINLVCSHRLASKCDLQSCAILIAHFSAT